MRSGRQSSLPPELAKLYSTAAWRRRRASQLYLESRCVACMHEGRVVEATVADHIESATDEQSFWFGALQSLCKPHHDSKRQAESQGKAWKPKLGCDANGMPLDPEHGWNG